MIQNVTRAQQNGRGDNDLLGIDNNRQFFYDCHIFDDVFLFLFERKSKSKLLLRIRKR